MCAVFLNVVCKIDILWCRFLWCMARTACDYYDVFPVCGPFQHWIGLLCFLWRTVMTLAPHELSNKDRFDKDTMITYAMS